MAERRMFAKTIIDSDIFLEMPLSTQSLYFHLSMRADDEGFVNNPRKIQRMVGGSDDDLKILIAKRFILAFESGIVVIKHWLIHNYIRTDRFKETVYFKEKSLLIIDENKAYTEKENDLNNDKNILGIPNDDHLSYQRETQVRLGKVRLELGKDNMGGKPTKATTSKTFIPPTLSEIEAYCKERNSNVNAKVFFDYFTEGGWCDSKGNKVRNWKQKLITWEKHQQTDKKQPPPCEYDFSKYQI